ncbi:AMP-dependent synthetase/ligase [Streptomyces daliensis]|uniref:Acyl-CoA synthetase n=2 Tax=Streptomyces daliensis TaxID=299421 RepID=A0A8T4IRV5_9ACTN|nr:long-chain fatty acid--CoA ligase [Streptomyces daliensis]
MSERSDRSEQPAPSASSAPGTGRPTRPATLALMAEWAGEHHGSLPALRYRSGDDGSGGDGGDGERAWTSVTFTELREHVRQVARGLVGGLGVAHGDRVAILSETRPEWTYAHLAAFATGAVVVPVYPTAGDEEVTWVLGDSGASVVICENEAQAAKIARLRDARPGAGPEGGGGLPALRHVVLMSAMAELPTPCSQEDLLKRAESVGPDDVCSIVYTSGTTGMPKGCKLTHGNITALHDSTDQLTESGPGTLTYLYLPLAHLLAQLIEWRAVLAGSEIAYFGGKIENVVSELAEVQPTHLPSVPRLFEKIYSMVESLAEARGPDGKERFEAAVRTGVEVADLRARGEEPTGELLERYEAADAQLFSLVRGVLGGRLRWALTGAAPIAPHVLDFLRACGIGVFEGYGMTESGGVISLNHKDAVRYGTVGRPIPGCEVRIAEDGEVLARGPMVFPGYHANEAATAETLDADGWLHTGDLGELDEDGYLRITGRKKELIITSAGKNLTPSQVELAIQQSRFVSRAVMIGDKRPYPVALITVDPETTEGMEPAEVRARVEEAVEHANAQVARPARIRSFAILDEDFSIEEGSLTPTLKVRRARVVDRYAARIEELYAAGRPSGEAAETAP